jgi:hypothetical protein
MRCLVRRAVSWCCLASSWRKIFSTAGAVTFVIASLPISLNTNVSSIQNALRRVGGLKLVAWAVSHSRATISKVTVLATFPLGAWCSDRCHQPAVAEPHLVSGAPASGGHPDTLPSLCGISHFVRLRSGFGVLDGKVAEHGGNRDSNVPGLPAKLPPRRACWQWTRRGRRWTAFPLSSFK